MYIVRRFAVLLDDVEGYRARREGDAVCEHRLRVVALELRRYLYDAGIHVLAALVAALCNIEVRLDEQAEENHKVCQQGEELVRSEEPPGVFMYKVFC